MDRPLIDKALLPIYLFLFSFICGSCNYIDGSLCTRACKKDDPPMTCHFQFEVETYYTMSKACYNCSYNPTDCFRPDCIPADGVERQITVVNRKLPGPSIQVCLGDTIVVDVTNSMSQDTTSIHWHGVYQKYTPYMDGVPFITQCPILPGTTFRYTFKAGNPGTHFWHSHSGMQHADGMFGTLIIRQPEESLAQYRSYDYDLPEHVIIVTDWLHNSVMNRFVAFYHSNSNADRNPDAILINGFGIFKHLSLMDNGALQATIPTFNVHQGKRYRFRIIHAGLLYCPVQISVDNHTLTVINSDGSDIEPVQVESLTIHTGERWDFVLSANRNMSNYWMKFRGLGDCGEKYKKAYGFGVLHYQGAANALRRTMIKYEDTERQGMHLNAVNVGAGQNLITTAAEIHAKKGILQDESLKEKPDVSLALPFDGHGLDNYRFHKRGLYGFHDIRRKQNKGYSFLTQINHISMKMPSFPPLSQPEEITANTFCNESTTQNCDKEFCYCVYKIDIPLNAVVELILIDEGAAFESNHPFHLHGHNFRVISMDRISKTSTSLNEVKKYDKAGKVHRNLHDPPLKDTVTVPRGGYTILRFHANNPGYWLLHCHNIFHLDIGMAVLFKVGEQQDFPQKPNNFPRCGNFYN